MNSDTLILIAGVVLSLLFSYIGKLNTWFAALPSDTQRLYMAGLLLVISGAIFGLACTGLAADLGITVTCDKAGAWLLIKTFILAVMSNQTAYAISPQTKAVKLTRSKRRAEESVLASAVSSK